LSTLALSGYPLPFDT